MFGRSDDAGAASPAGWAASGRAPGRKASTRSTAAAGAAIHRLSRTRSASEVVLIDSPVERFPFQEVTSQTAQALVTAVPVERDAGPVTTARAGGACDENKPTESTPDL